VPDHPLAVAVVGASGRMGSEACRAVEGAPDLRLVGRFGRGDDLTDLGGAAVAVELTTPDATLGNVVHCIERGVHVVVGTTGWDDARLAQLRDALSTRPEVGVLVAPNFSVGALLMMRFAATAARFYESVEVVELHHPDKVDAPSGTAARTARLLARCAARGRLSTRRSGARPSGRRPARGGRLRPVARAELRAGDRAAGA
jgi:4-hydroxy-tetrahydrodipicolinate reductase